MTPEQFYAANVQRWHCYPNQKMQDCGDNIEDHQVRCLDLACDFTDVCGTLYFAIRWHDQPEVILGDMSFTTKRDFPHLAAAWSVAEDAVIQRFKVPEPRNQWERDVLKFVDNLDAYMMIRKHAPEDLQLEDWKAARRWLLEMCHHLKFDMDLLCEKVGPCYD